MVPGNGRSALVMTSLTPLNLGQFRPAQAPRGSLDGLPFGAKDMFLTASRRPTCGFAEASDFGISEPSDVLARLEAEGGDLVGFTNMTELAYEPSGFNAARGRVRNPWNPDFVSGGSSSGSAAAVAGGAVVAEVASDTGGSLRIPAHCCGVSSVPALARWVTTAAAAVSSSGQSGRP